MHEKYLRDKQLADEKQRKRRETRENFAQEVDLVRRLQNEMEQERSLMTEKREQERAYLKKMLIENEKNKEKAEQQKA